MKYLSLFRKKRGLTQFELSELSGIASNTIARYEREEIKPSLEAANLLSQALNITVDELLNGPEGERSHVIYLRKEGISRLFAVHGYLEEIMPLDFLSF